MKMTKRLISILLAAVLAVSALAVSGTAFAADDYSGSTVIVYTANLRGDITKLPLVKGAVSFYEEHGADRVLLADTGNFLSGSIYATADRGYTVFSLMEETGYDYVNLEQYDFAFGNGQLGAQRHGTLVQYLTLSQLLNGGKSPVLEKEASLIQSVTLNQNGSNDSFPFTGNMTSYVRVPDTELVITGITDPSATASLLEESMSGIRFDRDKQIGDLKQDGDLWICLTNGEAPDDADVILKPSHPNTFSIGACIITADGAVSNEWRSQSDYTPDSALAALVAEKTAEIDSAYPRGQVAHSDVLLNGSTAAVRSEETNLGDLFTDALVWYATSGRILDFYNEDEIENGNDHITVDDDHIVSVWNGGNLRDYLYDGDVTLRDLERVLPYPNTVAVSYVTGATLLEALEAAMQYDAAFPQVAGIRYSINPDASFVAGEQYEASNYFAPAKISKVRIEDINGKPFDANATYAVITSNMLYNGGDTYAAFKNRLTGSNVTSQKVTAAVFEYIQTALDGNIGSAYAEAKGRIHEYSPLNGWVKEGSVWKYYVSDVAQTGWLKDGAKWYYLDKNGAMQTGWVKVSGKWYYLNKSGAMQTGWVKLSGKWYYLNQSGAMLTGWQKIGGAWYYLNASGAMQTGWVKLSGKWYYLDGSGKMRTANLTYKGKVYRFNSAGVCLNP